MAKTKTVYVCSNCGADSPKWLGKCPNCGEWNTYVEEIVTKEPAVKRPVPGIMEGNKIRPVNRIEQRILEAEKLGFSRIIIPHNNLKGFDTAKSKIQIVQVKKVEEAFRQLFG